MTRRARGGRQREGRRTRVSGEHVASFLSSIDVAAACRVIIENERICVFLVSS